MEADLRRLADRRPWLHPVDIDRLTCPMLPICDPVVGGVAAWQDGIHLTEDYATSLADGLYGALAGAGVFEG